MKIVILLLLLIIMVQAATTTSVSKTLVWATGTDADGNLATTQSPYTQTFTSFFSELESPSSGNIGLGSLSGKVGQIRSYEHTTISQENGGISFKSSNSFYLSPVPFFTKMLIGSLMSTLMFTLFI